MNLKSLITVASVLLVSASALHAGPIAEKPISVKSVSVASKASISTRKAAEQTTLLTVKVVADKGEPLEGFDVELTAGFGLHNFQSATTDSKGRVSFKGLAAGDYLLVIFADSGVEWSMISVKGATQLHTVKLSGE